MATTSVEIIVVKSFSEPDILGSSGYPFGHKPREDLNNDDTLMILDDNHPAASGVSHSSGSTCSALSGWTPDFYPGWSAIKVGKPAAGSQGKARGFALAARPSDLALFERGKRLTNFTPGTTCTNNENGQATTYQLYTADLID